MSNAPENVKEVWREIVSSLHEADLFILHEMLGDYIRMRQEQNVIDTPDSEEEVFQFEQRRNGLLN